MNSPSLQFHTAVTCIPIETIAPSEEEFSQYFWSAFGFLLALYPPAKSPLGRCASEPFTHECSQDPRLSDVVRRSPSITTPQPDRCKHGLTLGCCVTCKELENADDYAKRPARTYVMGPWMGFVYSLSGQSETEASTSGLKCDRPWTGKGCLPGATGRPPIIEPHSATPLQLAEYASRHKNDEAATVPHLPNYCDACLMYVTPRHDFNGCHAKAQAEQEQAGEMLAAKCEAKNKRTAAAHRIQMDDCEQRHARDLGIIETRLNTGETLADLTLYDRKLWNKSPRAKKCKYRIQ